MRLEWECKCDCGNTIICDGYRLRNWRIKSCRKCRRFRLKRIDLTGKRFGMLTVTSYSHSGNNAFWNCKCDCGNKTIVTALNLKTGNTTSCGKHKVSPMFVDISGQKYGRLTVISLQNKGKKCHPKNMADRTNWNCKCDCGNNLTVESHNLKSGHTQSCGCLQKERITTHGCCTRNWRLYNIWRGIHSRCYNKDNISYKHYGKRGITVCEEWHDPVKFLDWALANGYTKDLTIERENVNRIYLPGNCGWIPLSEQMQNTTVSLGKAKAREIRQCLIDGVSPRELAGIYNVAYTTITSIKNYNNYKYLTQ